MRVGRLKYYLFACMIFLSIMCRKPYAPIVIRASNHFLAVDGLINTGAGGNSTIILTRSLNLYDTIPIYPELNAQVLIQASGGMIYTLIDTGANGVYVSTQQNLDPSQQYQLNITTSEGNKYASDFVTPKISPPIDSLTWELVNDPVAETEKVNIYANAHDPTNNTRYYRWDYLETWQHRSTYESFWGQKNGIIYAIFPDESTYNCWTTLPSHEILLGSSVALSEDIINHVAIASFLKNDPKMDIEYSLLLRQYPLTAEAYNYWLTVQKNSQSLGGLFDLQPAQIKGNLHGVTNPKDPVLGYISASSVQEQRMFIHNGTSLPGWKSIPIVDCPIQYYPTDTSFFNIVNYPDTSYAVWYFVSGPPPVEKLTYKSCLDCRYQGGTNIKPAYWP